MDFENTSLPSQAASSQVKGNPHGFKEIKGECPKCGHEGWCSVDAAGEVICCRRRKEGAFKSKVDETGTPYYLHAAGEVASCTNPGRVIPGNPRVKVATIDKPPPPPRADVETLHAVYSAILNALSLGPPHREDLIRRGLSDEAIAKNGYRSLPNHQGSKIAAKMVKDFGETTAYTVPGLFKNDKGKPGLSCMPGLLIPVRDIEGRIRALFSRPDKKLSGGGKYLAVSSASHGGPSPGSPVHVPLGVVAPANVVRLTEGQLKADIATALSGVPTLGLQGLAWAGAVPLLKAIECEVARLAFDADATTNPHVAAGALRAARGLARDGFAVEVERWPQESGKGIDDILSAKVVPEVLSGPDALRWVESLQATNGQAERIAVEVSHERHKTLAQTLDALPRDPRLFVRGDALVRIERVAEDTVPLQGGAVLRHAAGAARVLPVEKAGLSCRLTEHCDFLSYGKDKFGEDLPARPTHPPDWLLGAVVEHRIYPGVRPLAGVCEIPFFRPDGSLCVEPGYDAATGYYLAPTVDIGPIPDQPDRDDYIAALMDLLDVVDEFPFVGGDDQAVWLAALLTAVARPSIAGPVPGFVMRGNRAGTGKGLLIDVIGILATGRPIPCTIYPRDDEESGKVLTSLAIQAASLVHFDNIAEGRSYGGLPSLDSAMTTMTVANRVLRTNDMPACEIRSLFFVSGNGIGPHNIDSARRWLPCSLVSPLEHPELRCDLKRPDLRAHVMENRAALVRAALVILKAHAAAGRPRGETMGARVGSFERWDDIVRGAVWFVTGLDCDSTRQAIADTSDDRMATLELLQAWAEHPLGTTQGLTTKLACSEETKRDYPRLADAIETIGAEGPLSLGKKIGAMNQRICGGLMFVKKGRRGNAGNVWVVASTGTEIPTRPA